MSVFVGVDGGGTKTEAVVAYSDSTNGSMKICGTGISGPSNATSMDLAEVVKNVCESIEVAVANASAQKILSLDSISVSLAGCKKTEDQSNVLKGLKEKLSLNFDLKKIQVGSDLDAVLAFGQVPEGDSLRSIGLICGTGSIAFSKRSDGQVVRSGGWGNWLGDQGSGYWLGKKSLQRIVRIGDLNNPKKDDVQFESKVKEFIDVKDTGSIPAWIQSISESHRTKTVAALAKVVFELSSKNEVAGKILQEGATYLAKDIENVIHSLASVNGKTGRLEYQLVFAGSLVCKQDFYREWILDRLPMGSRPSRIVVAKRPAEGALLLAKKLWQDPK